MDLVILTGIWWLVGFSGAMMPGPVTTLVVTESARRGFRAGPLVTIGHVVLELVMVIALYFGLDQLLNQNSVAGTIGILGGVFLLWMGWSIARSAWRGEVSFDATRRVRGAASSAHPTLAGMFATIANPYWVLWWASVGAANLIAFRAFGVLGIIAFYIGHTLADWVWNCVVAFVVATGRRVMTDRIYRGILLVCGLFLIALSVYFMRAGINFFLA
ncbi:MAG: LysE family transporter [Chloroflexi bacterium]|nr:LysE family transporter [Chloroflexota bacterium]